MQRDSRARPLLLVALTVAASCSGTDAPGAADSQRISPSAGSGATAPSANVPPAPSPDRYVALKACPFECCRYGTWRLRTAATVWREPSRTSDSLVALHAGARIVTDSGIVIVDPVGLAVITGTPRRRIDPSAPPLSAGDTLQLLDYLGEGVQRVRTRDSVFTVGFMIDSAGSNGVQLLRAPRRSWWPHLREPLAGWILMDSVRVRGADACSGEPPLQNEE